MIYVIPGEPVSLLRPRFSRNTQRVYNPSKNQMLITAITLQSQHNNQPLLEGPLHLDVTFFMPYPSTFTKTQKNNTKTIYSITRPDLSNLIKFIEDSAISIIYKDDVIISSICAKKVYSDNPRTEFSFQSLLESKNGSKTL